MWSPEQFTKPLAFLAALQAALRGSDTGQPTHSQTFSPWHSRRDSWWAQRRWCLPAWTFPFPHLGCTLHRWEHHQ